MKRSKLLPILALAVPVLAACGGTPAPAEPAAAANPYPPIRDTIATQIVGKSLPAGILLLILVVCGAFGLYWWLKGRQWKRPGTIAAGAFAAAFLAILFNGAYVTVPQGRVGVVLTQGAVGETLAPGANLILPYIQRVALVPTVDWTYITTSDPINKGNEDYRDFSFQLRTKDGILVTVNYTVQGRADPAKAADLVARYGTLENAITQRVKSPSLLIVRRRLQTYNAVDLITGVTDVEGSVSGELTTAMADGGLILSNFGFRTPELGPYGEQLEAARVAEQQAIAAQNQVAVTKAQAQQAAAKAEGDRLVAVAAAQGQAESNLALKKADADGQTYAAEQQAKQKTLQADADAYVTRTNAQAQAEANQKLAASITPDLIEYQRWLRWDGKLPTWQTSGQPVVTVPAPNAQEGGR